MTFTQVQYGPECFFHHSAGHLNRVESFFLYKGYEIIGA